MNDAQAAPSRTVVVDLGKHGRRRVRKLRKGDGGKLLDEVRSAVADLREQGVVGADAQTVIVVVERRRPRGRIPFVGDLR